MLISRSKKPKVMLQQYWMTRNIRLVATTCLILFICILILLVRFTSMVYKKSQCDRARLYYLNVIWYMLMLYHSQPQKCQMHCKMRNEKYSVFKKIQQSLFVYCYNQKYKMILPDLENMYSNSSCDWLSFKIEALLVCTKLKYFWLEIILEPHVILLVTCY